MDMTDKNNLEGDAKPTINPTKRYEFNVGIKAKREVRRTFAETKEDPIATLVDFQKKHSLHAMMSKAFGTTPVDNSNSDSKNVEPFQPGPVFTFLSHLGVSYQEIHRRILEALRSHLLEEIERTTATNTNNEALLNLLKESWAVSNLGVPELRPVLVAVLKKLEEDTPQSVLLTMASRDPATGNLKYGELLSELPLRMRRLVWEADAAAATDSSSLFQTMLQPLLNEYQMCSEQLKHSANLTFCAGIAERRILTAQVRRMPSNKDTIIGTSTPNTTVGNSGLLSTLSSKTSTTNESEKLSGKFSKDAICMNDKKSTHICNTRRPGDILKQIRELIGDRAKLFNLMILTLIAQHASGESSTTSKLGGTDRTILGGERYLHCCLLSDILLSFGSCVPKSYEHVCRLARVIDECVNSGTIEEGSIVQIQNCLRMVFEIPTAALMDSTPYTNSSTLASNSALTFVKKPPPPQLHGTVSAVNSTSATNESLQKAIFHAIVLMKLDDREAIFLNPVTDENVPGYSDVIHEPMCVRMMEEKAARGGYTELAEFERDVKLMFQNCITYNNGKDGQWFRSEARRQHKAFKDSTLRKAKEELKNQQRVNLIGTRSAEKRKSPSSTLSSAVGGVDKQAVVRPTVLVSQSQPSDSKDATVEPLPFIKSKKRKKDQDGLSMPAVATMMLADPFLIRLLLNKLYRQLHETLPSQKKIPSGDKIVPSVLQLLNLAQQSSQICASRGKRYVVPGPGFVENLSLDDQGDTSFSSLRKFMPLLTKLVVDAELDRRFAHGGDLHDVATQASVMMAVAQSDSDELWRKASSSSNVILRAVVQGALVYILQPGNSNEIALKAQLPRFVGVLENLVRNHREDFFYDRPFFLSIAHGLLRFKTRLPHATRDLVVRQWLEWLRGSHSDGKERVRTMTSPLHEIFVYLLNEVI